MFKVDHSNDQQLMAEILEEENICAMVAKADEQLVPDNDDDEAR